MIFDDFQSRKKKEFRPIHEIPGDAHWDFILLPCGYILNRGYEDASSGDILVFHGGEKRSIRAVRKIAMDSLCDALCRMRYGVPIKRALMQWQNNAVLLGSGKRSVSQEECLIVFYDDDICDD